MKLLYPCFFLSAFFVVQLSAAQPLSGYPEPVTVTVFTNGYGFFESQGRIPVEDSVFTMPADSLPKARYGTLWWSSPQDEIKHVKVERDSVEDEQKVGNMKELIEKNEGAEVTVKTGKGDRLNGRIGTCFNQYFMVEDSLGGATMVHYDRVQQLRFSDSPVISFDKKKARRTFRMTFGTPLSSKRPLVSMMHLEKGIRWYPQYLVYLDGNDAWVTLRAVLVNKARDLNNVKVNFAAGLPNLKYSEKVSPLVVEDYFNLFDMNKYRNRSRDRSGNRPRPEMLSKSRSSGFSTPKSSSEWAEGSFFEELYFFEKRLSLEKGARGMFKLFQADASLEHVYKVDLSRSQRSYGKDWQMMPVSDAPVWHMLRLQNKSNKPWPKGPATIMKSKGNGDQTPISQDEMPYTATGKTTYLPVTKTENITIETGEKLIGTQPNAKEHNDRSYDRKTIQGKLRIHNHKGEQVTMQIRKHINGELSAGDPKWTEKHLTGSPAELNPQYEVVWEVDIKKNNTQEITYQYDLYGH